MYDATSLPASVTKTGPDLLDSLASASRVRVAPAWVSGNQSDVASTGADAERGSQRSRVSQAATPPATSSSRHPALARQLIRRVSGEAAMPRPYRPDRSVRNQSASVRLTKR